MRKLLLLVLGQLQKKKLNSLINVKSGGNGCQPCEEWKQHQQKLAQEGVKKVSDGGLMHTVTIIGGDAVPGFNKNFKMDKTWNKMPETKEGKINDLMMMIELIHEVEQKANIDSHHPLIHDLKLWSTQSPSARGATSMNILQKFLRTPLISFPLNHLNQQDFHDSETTLLIPNHLQDSSKRLLQHDTDMKIGTDQRPVSCSIMDRKQSQQMITLSILNLCTLFDKRWLDSVAIDSYLHVLLEYHPNRDWIYIHSAEAEPNFADIQNTPSCYRFIIVPLFLDHHWTLLYINHNDQTIQYYNSQTVDQKTPKLQTNPFESIFPSYQVMHHTDVQQCDYSSCGVCVCFWSYVFLYESPDKYKIQCPSMLEFRRKILEQLILFFIVQMRQ